MQPISLAQEELTTYGPLAYSEKWRHISTHLDLVDSWDTWIMVRFPLELGLAGVCTP